MTDTQKIRIGIAVIIAQCILLAITFGFHVSMDRQADQDGISTIIKEASR